VLADGSACVVLNPAIPLAVFLREPKARELS
jgi:hypothetical protein